jgi:predicted nuclease of predicted toxin-antitoxin system
MKLKLDENVDARLAEVLRDAGHDAVTVREQGLHGSDDTDLYPLCISEERTLVTLDLGFSNIFQYPTANTPGLIVLRGPHDLFAMVRVLILTLIEALNKESSVNQLWIVEPGRIRIHE